MEDPKASIIIHPNDSKHSSKLGSFQSLSLSLSLSQRFCGDPDLHVDQYGLDRLGGLALGLEPLEPTDLAADAGNIDGHGGSWRISVRFGTTFGVCLISVFWWQRPDIRSLGLHSPV